MLKEQTHKRGIKVSKEIAPNSLQKTLPIPMPPTAGRGRRNTSVIPPIS